MLASTTAPNLHDNSVSDGGVMVHLHLGNWRLVTRRSGNCPQAGVSPARGRRRIDEGEFDRRKSEVGVRYFSALR